MFEKFENQKMIVAIGLCKTSGTVIHATEAIAKQIELCGSDHPDDFMFPIDNKPIEAGLYQWMGSIEVSDDDCSF